MRRGTQCPALSKCFINATTVVIGGDVVLHEMNAKSAHGSGLLECKLVSHPGSTLFSNVSVSHLSFGDPMLAEAGSGAVSTSQPPKKAGCFQGLCK